MTVNLNFTAPIASPSLSGSSPMTNNTSTPAVTGQGYQPATRTAGDVTSAIGNYLNPQASPVPVQYGAFNPVPVGPQMNPAVTATTPTVSASNVGTTQPITLPPPATPQSSPTIPRPQTPTNPQTGAPYQTDPTTGQIIIPPPVAPAAPSAYDQTLSKISGLNDQLATMGQVGSDLYNSLGIDQKTRDQISAYNDYNYAKTDQANKLEAIRTASGGTTAGAQQSMQSYQAQSDTHLANLAYLSAVATGNLTAAQNILTQKLDMQFKPIQDQINSLTSFAQLNQANLSDSQKAAITLKATQLQNNTDLLKSAMTTAHQFAQAQGITDINTLNAIDQAKTPAEAYQAVNMNANGTSNAVSPQSTGVQSLSPIAQQYVDKAADGTPFVSQDRLSNMTPYQKQQASAEYAKAGIRVLQPGEVTALNTIDQAGADLNLFESNAKQLLGSGFLGRVAGLTTNVAAQILQTNPQWRQFQTLRAGLIKSVQGIAAGAPGLRVTGAELSNAADALPNSTDNLESAQQAVDTFRSLLNVNKNVLLRTGQTSTQQGDSLPMVQTKAGAINTNW